jgi:hypothetical protein
MQAGRPEPQTSVRVALTTSEKPAGWGIRLIPQRDLRQAATGTEGIGHPPPLQLPATRTVVTSAEPPHYRTYTYSVSRPKDKHTRSVTTAIDEMLSLRLRA